MPTCHVPQALDEQHLHTVKICSTSMALLLLFHFRLISVAVWIEQREKHIHGRYSTSLTLRRFTVFALSRKCYC